MKNLFIYNLLVVLVGCHGNSVDNQGDPKVDISTVEFDLHACVFEKASYDSDFELIDSQFMSSMKAGDTYFGDPLLINFGIGPMYFCQTSELLIEEGILFGKINSKGSRESQDCQVLEWEPELYSEDSGTLPITHGLKYFVSDGDTLIERLRLLGLMGKDDLKNTDDQCEHMFEIHFSHDRD